MCDLVHRFRRRFATLPIYTLRDLHIPHISSLEVSGIRPPVVLLLISGSGVGRPSVSGKVIPART